LALSLLADFSQNLKHWRPAGLLLPKILPKSWQTVARCARTPYTLKKTTKDVWKKFSPPKDLERPGNSNEGKSDSAKESGGSTLKRP
jgi:hypothetical protein